MHYIIIRKNSIINTMKSDPQLAISILASTGISLLDAARLVINILDFKPYKTKLRNIQFCSKVIYCGLQHLHIKEMSLEKGYEKYLQTKTHLRPSSLRDIKYLGNKLLQSQPRFSKATFSELSISDCEKWLSSTFRTPSQFNKAHSMLHGLFQYALRQEWIEKNNIKLIEKKKIVEQKIESLSLTETHLLLKITQQKEFISCAAAVGLLIWAGLRPTELTRLKWQDIDLEDKVVSISPSTSKTGGSRHIEICSALKKWLHKHKTNDSEALICPANWQPQWKKIRDLAGFRGRWVQDVLRHTYASYYTKCYQNLHKLQINMGHSNQNLLHTRYVNMRNISKIDAKRYFSAI